MIIDAILSLLSQIGEEMVRVFHLPIISELPWGIDSILLASITSIKTLGNYFPPFYTVLIAFGIYLGFLILIRVLRMIPIIGRFID